MLLLTSWGGSFASFRATYGVSIAHSDFCTAGFWGVSEFPPMEGNKTKTVWVKKKNIQKNTQFLAHWNTFSFSRISLHNNCRIVGLKSNYFIYQSTLKIRHFFKKILHSLLKYPPILAIAVMLSFARLFTTS